MMILFRAFCDSSDIVSLSGTLEGLFLLRLAERVLEEITLERAILGVFIVGVDAPIYLRGRPRFRLMLLAPG